MAKRMPKKLEIEEYVGKKAISKKEAGMEKERDYRLSTPGQIGL